MTIDKQALRQTAEKAQEHGVFNMDIHSETVLALLDELEVKGKQISELQNDEVRQRLANAEHQLHMAELAKHNLRASRKAQFRKRKAAERRVAELEARLSSNPASWVEEPVGDDEWSKGGRAMRNAISTMFQMKNSRAAGNGKGE